MKLYSEKEFYKLPAGTCYMEVNKDGKIDHMIRIATDSFKDESGEGTRLFGEFYMDLEDYGIEDMGYYHSLDEICNDEEYFKWVDEYEVFNKLTDTDYKIDFPNGQYFLVFSKKEMIELVNKINIYGRLGLRIEKEENENEK